MRRTGIITVAAAAASMLAASAALATGTIRVDEDGDAGWLFNRDTSTSTPYTFSLDEASTGGGSLYVEPIENLADDGVTSDRFDKFVAEQFLGTSTSAVASIGYDFLIAGSGDASDAGQFYLNVYTNLPDSPQEGYYDCRFDYTPSTGSTSAWTTVTFAATDTPAFVAERAAGVGACPATLAQMPEGSWLRMFSVNVGDTSLSDTGLAGYLDAVVVTTTSGTTTFDFEVPVPVKDACKDGGWASYGFANQGECVSTLQANDSAGKR